MSHDYWYVVIVSMLWMTFRTWDKYYMWENAIVNYDHDYREVELKLRDMDNVDE